MEQLRSLSALQANSRDDGASLLPLPLLQEALRNVQELAWYIFYPKSQMDGEPLHQSFVFNACKMHP
jgi:hypothetical protein